MHDKFCAVKQNKHYAQVFKQKNHRYYEISYINLMLVENAQRAHSLQLAAGSFNSLSKTDGGLRARVRGYLLTEFHIILWSINIIIVIKGVRLN